MGWVLSAEFRFCRSWCVEVVLGLPAGVLRFGFEVTVDLVIV